MLSNLTFQITKCIIFTPFYISNAEKEKECKDFLKWVLGAN